MDIEIDVSATEAVYEQIVRQIRLGVQNGSLASGMPLPSIRQLADDLDLNHNTVAKAYKILEYQRVINTAGRRGTFVHAEAANHVDNHNVDEATHKFKALLSELNHRGLSVKQIKEIFRNVVSSIPSESPN